MGGTDSAADAFDDLPDPAWEIGADDLVVRAANAAARATGIAVGDRVEQLPIAPDSRAGAFTALRATLRSGHARRGLDWTLSGVHHAVDLVRVLDDDGRVRGVLAQARVIPDPAPVHLVPAGGDGPSPDPQTGPNGPDGDDSPAHNPSRVPVPGAFRLAVHRLAAAGTDEATGDWFGAVALQDGRLVLMVGGVPDPAPDPGDGGDRAPVVIGGLRAVLSEALRAGEPLTEAVRRADAAAARLPAGHGATLTAAVLDPRSGTVEHVSCGHCPPLLCLGSARGPGVVRPLAGPSSGPLGVGAPVTVPHVEPLAPGSALVLCSNDLVERPGRPVTAGVDELAAALRRSWRPTDAPAAADALCAQVLDALPAGCEGVLMAATVPAGTARAMATRITADPRRIVGVRERLETWLRETGVPSEVLASVPIVASELVTNAVQHAYPPGVDGPVRVRAAHESPSALVLTVSDDGSWGPPTPVEQEPRRGFGLAVARNLADALDIDSGPRGTTVRARFGLTRPVVVRHGDAPHLRVAGPGFGMLTSGEPPTRLRVHGPIGPAAAEDLRSALLYTTAGGTRAITLDLAEVTELGAEAVRVLHEFAGFADPSPAVRAPEGSVARAMLALADLGSLVDDTLAPDDDPAAASRIR
ncbi:stage II sporulation protein E [Pseudonocardia sediminis]|uniref:Stage II sporulation protein E n=1 Tax=Pseudonocardia sediminis TaxID=1397368 RepID=A0A4Q7UYP4_PSEST|nr:ATP-binding protein [Pseudonocardia sediminis]RZT87247.1 stage II sporulation protein E [Pseudonocardia sediminis]